MRVRERERERERAEEECVEYCCFYGAGRVSRIKREDKSRADHWSQLLFKLIWSPTRANMSILLVPRNTCARWLFRYCSISNASATCISEHHRWTSMSMNLESSISSQNIQLFLLWIKLNVRAIDVTFSYHTRMLYMWRLTTVHRATESLLPKYNFTFRTKSFSGGDKKRFISCDDLEWNHTDSNYWSILCMSMREKNRLSLFSLVI